MQAPPPLVQAPVATADIAEAPPEAGEADEIEEMNLRMRAALLQSNPYSEEPLPIAVCGSHGMFLDVETLTPFYMELHSAQQSLTFQPPWVGTGHLR